MIACASLKYATVFHLSKHGLRPDEISKITLRDLDLNSGALSVRTSKMGLDRTLKLKSEAFDLLRDYVNRLQISNLNERRARTSLLKLKRIVLRLNPSDKEKLWNIYSNLV